jgi:hypothetical protein
MSVNDGPRGEAPSETQFTQTWSTIETEHIHNHFREHFKYWQRHPLMAAKNCVRNWRQKFPDEADKLPVDEIVKYRGYLAKNGQLVRFAMAKRRVLAPRVQQPKGAQGPSVMPW